MQRCACKIISCNLEHGGCVARQEFEVLFAESVLQSAFVGGREIFAELNTLEIKITKASL